MEDFDDKSRYGPQWVKHAGMHCISNLKEWTEIQPPIELTTVYRT